MNDLECLFPLYLPLVELGLLFVIDLLPKPVDQLELLDPLHLRLLLLPFLGLYQLNIPHLLLHDDLAFAFQLLLPLSLLLVLHPLQQPMLEVLFLFDL
jgi:hypothetical protein